MTPSPLDFTCHRCTAPPRLPCITKNGKPCEPHADRRHQAWEAKRNDAATNTDNWPLMVDLQYGGAALLCAAQVTYRPAYQKDGGYARTCRAEISGDNLAEIKENLANHIAALEHVSS